MDASARADGGGEDRPGAGVGGAPVGSGADEVEVGDAAADAGPAATLAEALALTGEVAEAIARIAEGELEAGRAAAARTILEGLAVANPRDPLAWVLLSRVHRALSQPLAARFCAEVAGALEPESPWARLARAEALLGVPEERSQAIELLRQLAPGPRIAAGVAGRAGALLAAVEAARTG